MCNRAAAILYAKWKRLNLGEQNSGVSSDHVYQMQAYAGRYRCKRLALVYPPPWTARQERSRSSCS
ncbi:5-methylcytosine restriction system specificity protein McrC [Cypionkella sp.]|uniref:5-methylcytosine restriction system specificity protein McrC n=1 Tax=Cypionkella sp. TaxID=2811411 RepID=UPI003A0FD1E5